MEYFLIFWLLFAVVCAWVGHEKGRSAIAWLVLGALFGLLALLVLACLPSLRPVQYVPHDR